MSYQQKYIKYKKKYLELKKQTGGNYLDSMPKLCFGTAQNNLRKNLKKVLEIGIRHIDCADAYSNFHDSNMDDYYKIIQEEISSIPREQLWITWKSNDITINNITNIINKLQCGYIDTFLTHFGCHENNSILFNTFKLAQKSKLIRFYGVSNCENIETLCKLKQQYEISTNQIQARPPNGSIDGRKKFTPNFIKQCNSIGINIMLFATVSGYTEYLSSLMNLDIIPDMNLDIIPDINKYYMQKYCLCNSNVLMIGSVSGHNLPTNKANFDDVMNGHNLLSVSKMKEIEEQLEKIVLAKM
jgi:diketogulonate reductase-like aldo/keto reductase